VLFRSLLVPITAIAGFLLSVVATFGAVVAVFQWGWLAGLFGVDYEVFLVSRMREEHMHGAPPIRAVTVGYAHGARVVTAAAIIMIGVFAGFLLAPDPLIKSIGFALAAAILLDAFLVRMTIVPAVMALLGRRAWELPRWLDRLLPNVDVEGERLLDAVPDEPPTMPKPVGASRSAKAAESIDDELVRTPRNVPLRRPVAGATVS
jgi:RND superfamily putative drug exporter